MKENTTKEKLVALLLISVMVASVFGAIGLSATKVDAATGMLTLSSTNYSPTPGQQYTLWGYLRDSTGKTLAYKPIDIFYRFPGEGWKFSNTLYTDANGKYETATSSSRTVILQTGYKVGGVYVASSNLVTITVSPLTLTLDISISPPTQGLLYSLSGYLRDSAGKGLAHKPIDIFYRFPGEGWKVSNTVYTDANGKYETATSSMKAVYLQTGYKVGGVYVASSNVLTVTPRIATLLTVNMGTATDGTNYLYGRLTEKYTGTPMKATIGVWVPASMSPWWSSLGYTGTNDNGEYTFSRLIYQDGQYMVNYPGDLVHTGSGAYYNWP